MAKTNRRKPYYTLREIYARWAMDADDISAYVLEGELSLSLPVAALLMEVSDTHQAADGRIRVEPKGRQHQVGPIDLSRIDADTGARGNQAFSFAGTTPEAHGVWSVQSGNGRLVEADVTGDGRADFQILVQNISSLGADNFIL